MRKICTVNDTVTFEYDHVMESIRKIPVGRNERIVRFLTFDISLTLQEASSFVESKERLFNLNGNITSISTEFEEGVTINFSSDYQYIEDINISYDNFDVNNLVLASINFTTREVNSYGEDISIGV